MNEVANNCFTRATRAAICAAEGVAAILRAIGKEGNQLGNPRKPSHWDWQRPDK